MIPDTERAEMTERLAKITPGEWEGFIDYHSRPSKYWNFIAHAPDDMRKLLVENAELRALSSTSDVVNAPKIEALATRLERIHKAVYESDWNTIYEIAEGADIRASTIAEIQRLCEAKALKCEKQASQFSRRSHTTIYNEGAMLELLSFARELEEMK